MRCMTSLGAILMIASLSSNSNAEPPSATRVDTIHGLQVGQDCDTAANLARALGPRGYKMAASSIPCAPAQADFSSVLLFADHEERLERLDIGFAPGGRVWKLRLDVEWKAEARLFTKPNHQDLVNSLSKRYGAPGQVGGVKSIAASGNGQWTAQQDLVWQVTAGPEKPQSRWAWTKPQLNLSGIVMEASVFSEGASGEVALTLKVTNREWESQYAASQAAGSDAEKRKAMARSASFLRGF